MVPAPKRSPRNHVRESGLGYTIIRPSWVYGPEDRSLNLFVRALRLNPLFFPQIGDGTQRLNPLYAQGPRRRRR